MPDPAVCTRCVLPENFPGVSFDGDGLCSLCRSAPDAGELRRRRGDLKGKLDAAVAGVDRGGSYDCVVAFSGGKDSSYTLALLVEEYGLRCLAVTIDNGFLSDRALENARVVTRALGVDFVTFAPAWNFMQRMYRASATEPGLHAPAAATRASSICNSCIGLINNHMIRIALQNGVPMIAGGYIAGQVPKDSVVLELDMKTRGVLRRDQLDRYVNAFGPDAARYFELPDQLLALAPERLAIINPLLALVLTEDDIIERIATLGWRMTSDAGAHSTNCRLNDLGIVVHYKQQGFHPYVAELAEQVRAGLMERTQALAKLADLPAAQDVGPQADKIGLSLDVLS